MNKLTPLVTQFGRESGRMCGSWSIKDIVFIIDRITDENIVEQTVE